MRGPEVDRRLKTFDILSPAECASVRSWVHEVRPRWEQRDPELSYYTLGAASHLDAVVSARSYQVKAAESNGLLWDQLEWLYQRLGEFLTQEFDTQFFYDKSLALPGFHIFLDPALSCKGAGKHFDLEHLLIDWGNYQDLDATDRLSLTLAIHLPASGAGLWLWDINYLDMEELSPEAVKMACVQHSKGTLHPYAPGKLYLHSGYQLHKIGASNDFQPGQERLTLQAHAQRVRQGYVLYW